MILPCTVRIVEFLDRQAAGSDQLGHAHKLLLGVAFILIFEQPDRLAGTGDIRMKPEIIDAVLKRKDLGLSVEGQIQCFQIRSYNIKTMFQIFLAGVNQVKVIHIPAVIFYTQLMLYQLIHAVQVEQRKALVNLVTQRDAPTIGAVNKLITEPAHIGVISKVIMHNVF